MLPKMINRQFYYCFLCFISCLHVCISFGDKNISTNHDYSFITKLPSVHNNIVNISYTIPLHIIMFGLSARGETRTVCTPSGKTAQLVATKTQTKLFSQLEDQGYSVELFLATNLCKNEEEEEEEGLNNSIPSFEALLVDYYGHWLKDHYFGNCEEFPDGKCLMQKGLNLFRKYLVNTNRYNSSLSVNMLDVVFFTRPDLHYLEQAFNLVTDMSRLALKNNFAWPFMCKNESWVPWQCVADTMLAVRYSSFDFFTHQCVGHNCCYPEYTISGDGEPIPWTHSRTAPRSCSYSGHGCYLCVKTFLDILNKKETNSSDIKFPVFARNENRVMNTRIAGLGENPYYFFAEGPRHISPTALPWWNLSDTH